METRPVRRALLPIACLCAAFFAGSVSNAAAEDNGVALTPPMGWNDWYSVYCGVNAQLVEQTAQEMVADGMKAAGYDYVNIDDCWMASSRDAAGNLVADPTRFPDGIKPVADYVHSLGLKLGIYEDAGTTTCAGYPGSFGHEAQDAAAFASWGVDYVKYDRCNIPYADFPGESEQQVQQTLYTRMSNALKATGRPIVFSMCNPDPGDDPWVYGASIANMWRTATDIQDNFGSILANFEATVGHFASAGPGAWNDPDLLQIGNGGSSLSDYTSEFSLWAEMAAPLIASTNLATLTHSELAIYENPDVIAVDQDRLGRPGVPISSANGLWVLSKQLSGGGRAVLLFNATNTAATISTTATAAGLPRGRGYQMQNLWTNAVTQTGGAISAFVPGHGVAMFTVTAVGKRPDKMPPYTVLSLEAARPRSASAARPPCPSPSRISGCPTSRSSACRCRPRAAGRSSRSAGPARGCSSRGSGSRSPIESPRRRQVRRSPYRSSPAGRRTTRSTAGARRWRGSASWSLLRCTRRSATVDVTAHRAAFGASGRALAISARGLGVFNPPFGALPTDSYAAIYRRGGCGLACTAQVTVTADPAGGTSGGAGLIERDDMAAGKQSPAGVVLFVNDNATIVLAWNGAGGADVDQNVSVGSGTAKAPVGLRLVRQGNTYAGYYSTDQGKTWNPVGMVTVAASASGGPQDVGVFHASGLTTWTTTATFRDFRVR